MNTTFFRIPILLTILILFLSSTSIAQNFLTRPPTETENPLQQVYASFNDLMDNPDTTLKREKKMAQRWMNYVFPYLEMENGQLTNSAFKNALKAAMGSSSECTNDPANWISDGPINIPDWSFAGR
jgi:hypothetical protein